MNATTNPTPTKPAVFVSDHHSPVERAIIVDLRNRYVFAEVPPSRGTSAQELAMCAIEEFRRATGAYPSSDRNPPDAAVTPFGVFLEHYCSRVVLGEESARLLPKNALPFHTATAAMAASRQGQLLTYLQAVTMFAAMGKKGGEAADLMNVRLQENAESENELIDASPPGTSLDGMMHVNVERVAFAAAATIGLTELPRNVPALGSPASTTDTARTAWWELAEKISPWWAKHAASFLADKAPQQNPSLFDCPGLTPLENIHAIEALNGIQHLQRNITAQGKNVALADVIGYDDQWKSLFVLSLMSPNSQSLADAARDSAPLALSLRRRSVESQGQSQTTGAVDPVALPEPAAASNRRRFRLG